jgi:hypothetical protein
MHTNGLFSQDFIPHKAVGNERMEGKRNVGIIHVNSSPFKGKGIISVIINNR